MTDNEAMMTLGRSPTVMAVRMAQICGATRARELVESWIRGLSRQPNLSVKKVAFWANVAMRLEIQ